MSPPIICFSEINYNIREVLKLPPAPALEILRGQLEIRLVQWQRGFLSIVDLNGSNIYCECSHV